MQELEICVFGFVEGYLPQVMVPEGRGESETPTDKLIVIFLSFL